MKNQEKKLLDSLNEIEVFEENIKAPEEVDRIFDNVKISSEKRMKRIIIKRRTAWVMGIVLIFMMSVNLNSAIAETIYKIPVIGEIARVITVREYNFENENSKMDIKTAEIEVDGKPAVEEKINKLIESRVQSIIQEQKKIDEEYKEAYIETGGKVERLKKIETKVDYKIHYSDENIISFLVFKSQTLASAYDETYYLNIDLKTGEKLVLEDIMRVDQEVIKKKVISKMEERMKEKENEIYDVEELNNMEISKGRKFYVNQKGDIVLVFDKYEVAAGYLGEQFFVIGKFDGEDFISIKE